MLKAIFSRLAKVRDAAKLRAESKQHKGDVAFDHTTIDTLIVDGQRTGSAVRAKASQDPAAMAAAAGGAIVLGHVWLGSSNSRERDGADAFLQPDANPAQTGEVGQEPLGGGADVAGEHKTDASSKDDGTTTGHGGAGPFGHGNAKSESHEGTDQAAARYDTGDAESGSGDDGGQGGSGD